MNPKIRNGTGGWQKNYNKLEKKQMRAASKDTMQNLTQNNHVIKSTTIKTADCTDCDNILAKSDVVRGTAEWLIKVRTASNYAEVGTWENKNN